MQGTEEKRRLCEFLGFCQHRQSFCGHPDPVTKVVEHCHPSSSIRLLFVLVCGPDEVLTDLFPETGLRHSLKALDPLLARSGTTLEGTR